MVINIRREDPDHQFALLRVSGYDCGTGMPSHGGTLEGVQSKPGLPGLLIGAVTVIAVFCKDGPDFTPEIRTLIRHHRKWPEEKD